MTDYFSSYKIYNLMYLPLPDTIRRLPGESYINLYQYTKLLISITFHILMFEYVK